MKSFLSKVVISLASVSTAVVVLAALVVGVRQVSPELKPAIATSDNPPVSPDTQSNTLADGSQPSPDASSNPDKATANSDNSSAAKPQPADKSSQSPEAETTKPHRQKDAPVDRASQPAYLQLQSTPPGARVEVGMQFTNWNITPGTGQKTCITPCVVKLDPSDVALLPNGSAHLVMRLEKAGFAPHLDVIDLGNYDRSMALLAGKTYDRSITLQSQLWSRVQQKGMDQELLWDIDS